MVLHPTIQKFENLFSMGFFCPKYIRFELKNYGGVIFHDTEQWWKIWMKLDRVVSKLALRIAWTFIRTKSKKLYIHGLFLSKKCNVSARKSHTNYVSWYWRVIQNIKKNWLVTWKMIKNLVNFHVSSPESPKSKVLDEKAQKSYVS